MKRNTPTHFKVDELMDELDIPRYAAIGLLESLWHITAANTPRGDIGKYTNKTLARRLDWKDDADDLINALVKSRWLDADDEHRLIVHDWSEHADDATQMKVGRLGEAFADGKIPNLGRMGKDEREKCLNAIGTKINDPCTRDEHAVSTALALPSPPNPSLGPPLPTPPGTVPTPDGDRGSGSFASLGGVGSGSGVGSDLMTQLEKVGSRVNLHGTTINRLALDAGIENEGKRAAISQRTDLTPELVESVIAATRADPTAKDPARLIAHRLGSFTLAQLEAVGQSSKTPAERRREAQRAGEHPDYRNLQFKTEPIPPGGLPIKLGTTER